MGFLGLVLLFVGIVLFINGIAALIHIDAKAVALMNFITAFIIITGNLIMLNKATDTLSFQNVASGYLFGFTYVLLGFNYLFKLDSRVFGFYSGFASIYAIMLTILVFPVDIKLSILWGIWSLIWIDSFLELALKVKLPNIFPYLLIFQGIFTTFLPSLFMLTGKW